MANDNPVLPPDNQRADWPRLVAMIVNRLVNRTGALESVFTPGDAPASPVEGQTYYDRTTHKMRTWDGSAWRDHW